MGNMGFGAPLFLFMLLGLPLLWWLIRRFPPRPLVVRFPPFQILQRLQSRFETSQVPPWWLLLLRLLVAAVVIVIFAGPYLKPVEEVHTATLKQHSHIVLVVDNGFGAARNWQAIQRQGAALLQLLREQNAQVALLPTAKQDTQPPAFEPLEAVRARLNALAPMPQAVLRAPLGATVNTLLAEQSDSMVIWLSDGVEYGDGETFLNMLPDNVTKLIYAPDAHDLPLLMRRAETSHDGLTLRLTRIGTGQSLAAISALNTQGVGIFTHQADLESRSGRDEIFLPLPPRLMNQTRAIRIEGQQHSGALWLMDGRAMIQTAGVVSAAGGSQPLLQETFYIEKALQGVARVSKGPVSELLEEGVGLIALPDAADLTKDERDTLHRWVEDGGVLIRFAGPRLGKEAVDNDPLLPVALRGSHAYSPILQGNAAPPALVKAEDGSPLQGLAPEQPIAVRVLVMADPLKTPNDSVWARISDQSPLITGKVLGKGYVVLCHTAALPAWSELPLSGTMVTLFERLLQLTRSGSRSAASGPLYPQSLLDGFGNLQKPSENAAPISESMLVEASPKAPVTPGYYGNAGGVLAVSQAQSTGIFQKLDVPGIRVYGQEAQPVTFLPWLASLLLVLWIADSLVQLAGRFRLLPGTRAAAAILLTGFFMMQGEPAAAKADRPYFTPMIAYVKTGNPETDQLSALGLAALTEELARRTSFEGGAPVGVDINSDDLTLYPVLYWPLSRENAQTLQREGLVKLRQFMRTGGMLIVDLRDGNPDTLAEEAPGLARIFNLSDVGPVNNEHVLTRTFYLLQQFPGRWNSGTVWVEYADETVNDGVSPIIIGTADWAAAWARDSRGQPLLPVVPGGEQQRELAYRSGINFMLYALAGNYKADQIHLPTLLERLGK